MTTTEAQRQVSTYGVVLTLEEEETYALKAAAMDDVVAVMTVAEDLGSYAGAIVQDDKAPYSLQVFLSKSGEGSTEERAWLSEVISSLKGPLTVSIDSREFSIGDLTALGQVLAGNEPTAHLDKEQIAKAVEAADQQGLPSGTLFGYSMRHGTLTAQLPIGERGAGFEDFSLGQGLPDVQVIATMASHDDWGPADQGSAACGRFWCGAPKGGHIVRFKSGGSFYHCSWAGGLRVRPNGTSVWTTKLLTAGHCGSPTNDETFYNFQNQGSSTSTTTHFGIVPTTAADDTIGTEWRNSTERAGDAWGDFQLVNTSTSYASNLILTGNTTSARTTNLAFAVVGLDVCISARSTGVKCDEIDDNGWVKTIDGKSVTHLAITRGSYDASGGDSGATLYTQGSPHQLVGVHQGDKTNAFGLRYQLFSRVTLVDNSPNMNITSIQPIATDGRRDFIAGLYTRNLNRLPDNGGYNYWRNNVMSTCNLSTAQATAESFMFSTEFKNRFPIATGSYSSKLNNARLRVYYAYRTFFGRDPDLNGLSYWLNTVMVNSGINVNNAEGAWSTVVNSFSASAEFLNRVQGPTALADGAICA